MTGLVFLVEVEVDAADTDTDSVGSLRKGGGAGRFGFLATGGR